MPSEFNTKAWRGCHRNPSGARCQPVWAAGAEVRGMAVRGMKTGLGQFPFPIPLTSIPLTFLLAASTGRDPQCRAMPWR